MINAWECVGARGNALLVCCCCQLLPPAGCCAAAAAAAAASRLGPSKGLLLLLLLLLLRAAAGGAGAVWHVGSRSSKRNPITCSGLSGGASARVLLVRAHLLVAYFN
jgi:hypothetical protein